MKDYTKLAKALRYHSSDYIECDKCAYYDDCRNGAGLTKMMTDAANAIEELQAVAERLKEENPIVESVLVDKLMQRIGYLEQQIPKHGEWKERYDTQYHYECPFCRYLHQYKDNYCPNCGAKMGVQE